MIVVNRLISIYECVIDSLPVNFGCWTSTCVTQAPRSSTWIAEASYFQDHWFRKRRLANPSPLSRNRWSRDSKCSISSISTIITECFIVSSLSYNDRYWSKLEKCASYLERTSPSLCGSLDRIRSAYDPYFRGRLTSDGLPVREVT